MPGHMLPKAAIQSGASPSNMRKKPYKILPSGTTKGFNTVGELWTKMSRDTRNWMAKSVPISMKY